MPFVLRFEDILDKVETYLPGPDEDLIRRAYVVSAHEHRNQLRSSGEPYLVHPLAVAMILAEMKLDETTIATGLLHDVLEDTEMTKDRLEKLSFKSLHPEEWDSLTAAVSERMKASTASIERLRQELLTKTKEAGVEAEITGRLKRYWSIRQKLIRQSIPLEQLYDILAFRILVPSVRDCYSVLGLAHQAWRPV